MTIIPDQTSLSPTSVAGLDVIQAHGDGLNAIAAFLKAHADLLPRHGVTVGGTLTAAYIWYGNEDTARASIEAWAAAAVAAGIRVEPYASHTYAGINLHFGPTTVQVYTRGHVLGERVQVVTEEWRPNITIPGPASVGA